MAEPHGAGEHHDGISVQAYLVIFGALSVFTLVWTWSAIAATFANTISKNARYVIDVLWLYDHLRDIPVRAGVRCIAHQVADAMPHNLLAKYLDQISLKLFRSSTSKLFVYSVRAGWYIRTTDACGVC